MPDDAIAALAAELARPTVEELNARTALVRALTDFVARPLCAYRGADGQSPPDEDVVSAYNLAIIAALQGIRRAATI